MITTADHRYWKTDEPVLFLGEWCKLYSDRALWQNMQYEVLSYHWDDRKKLFANYQYLQGLYERVLVDMVRSLNAIHDDDHSLRYWRIIIGPWLFFFIHVFYDRYVCIEKAAQSHKVSGTMIGKYDQNDWVPRDYVDFSGWVTKDAFNQFLYSWIIERVKPFSYSYQKIDNRENIAEKQIDKKTTWVKRLSKKMMLAYEGLLPHRFNKFVFISSYLRAKDQWLLQLSLGQWPSLFSPEVKEAESEVNLAIRTKVVLSCAGNQFERLLAQIIPSQIPRAYLENYTFLKEQALAKYPASPKVILTACDFFSNESFKIFSAEHAQHGTRLVGIQHGGNYGTALFLAFEEHELRISDTYYTWGWQTDEGHKAKPLPAVKLNRFRKDIVFDPQGNILLTLGLMPRYSYHLYSVYLSSTGTLAYFQDQFSFIRGLNDRVYKDLLIRTYPQDYEWSQRERFQEFFPDVVFDHRKSIIESMKASRLFITTYNATTFLESFTANFPTIMFWNPEHWELRDSAKPYFDQLKKVGILHDTPQRAAQKVNEIFLDPGAWWQGQEVQEAKNNFCSRFANTSDHWLENWRNDIGAQ